MRIVYHKSTRSCCKHKKIIFFQRNKIAPLNNLAEKDLGMSVKYANFDD
jgi:hypothetical protein